MVNAKPERSPQVGFGAWPSRLPLEDVIRSKQAADRSKDRRSLPLVQQLLDEIKKRNSEQTLR
jgi:hypothetical protein